MDEIPIDNSTTTWKSCCIEADRGFVLFFCQFAISVIVVILCSYQLITLTECQSQSLYSGILTLILGTWIPTQRLGNR